MKIMDEQKIWKGNEYCNVSGSQEVAGLIPFRSTRQREGVMRCDFIF